MLKEGKFFFLWAYITWYAGGGPMAPTTRTNYDALLEELKSNVELEYPDHKQYEGYIVLATDKSDKATFDPKPRICSKCGATRVFMHAFGRWDANCQRDVTIADNSGYKMNFCKAVKALPEFLIFVNDAVEFKNRKEKLQDEGRWVEPVETASSFDLNVSNPSVSTNTNSNSSTQVRHTSKAKWDCPGWSKDESLESYLIILENWFEHTKDYGKNVQFSMIYEALKKCNRDDASLIAENYLTVIASKMADIDDDLFDHVKSHLQKNYGQTKTQLIIQVVGKLMQFKRDESSVEQVINTFLKQKAALLSLKLELPEPFWIAILLNALSLDQHTLNIINNEAGDIFEAGALTNVLKSIRQYCKAEQTVSTNYASSRRRSRSKSRDRDRDRNHSNRDSTGKRRSGSNDSFFRHGKDQHKSPRSRESRGSSSYHRDLRSAYVINQESDDVFTTVNFTLNDQGDKDYLIVDSGAPVSILCYETAEKVIKSLSKSKEPVKFNDVTKRFKFGPSRIYLASQSITFPLAVFTTKDLATFYVIDEQNSPNLLGMDTLAKLGLSIDPSAGCLFRRSKSQAQHDEIFRCKRTKSGHLAINPLLTNIQQAFHVEDDDAAYMFLQFSESEEDGSDGHARADEGRQLAGLAARDEAAQESEVQRKSRQFMNIHRYSGHIGLRQLWKFLRQSRFATKADKKLLQNILAGCQVCKRKAWPVPRPKVSLPKAYDCGEVVAIDLKDYKKLFGFYIMYFICEFSNNFSTIICLWKAYFWPGDRPSLTLAHLTSS